MAQELGLTGRSALLGPEALERRRTLPVVMRVLLGCIYMIGRQAFGMERPD